MSREPMRTREEVYRWLCKMCNVQKEDLELFIDTIIKTPGHYGLDAEEQELLKECKVDVWAEKIFLEEE